MARGRLLVQPPGDARGRRPRAGVRPLAVAVEPRLAAAARSGDPHRGQGRAGLRRRHQGARLHGSLPPHAEPDVHGISDQHRRGRDPHRFAHPGAAGGPGLVPVDLQLRRPLRGARAAGPVRRPVRPLLPPRAALPATDHPLGPVCLTSRHQVTTMGIHQGHDHLVSIAQHQARTRPGSFAFGYSADGETESQRLTYAELDTRARAIAARLQAGGATDRAAMLIYAGDASFFTAFLACLYARVIAVPIPVGRALPARIAAIVDDCAPVLALSSQEHVDTGRAAFALHPKTSSIPWLATDLVASELAADWRPPRVDAATLAYLQYTSGSTAEPKGVMISHGNILANLRIILE